MYRSRIVRRWCGLSLTVATGGVSSATSQHCAPGVGSFAIVCIGQTGQAVLDQLGRLLLSAFDTAIRSDGKCITSHRLFSRSQHDLLLYCRKPRRASMPAEALGYFTCRNHGTECSGLRLNHVLDRATCRSGWATQTTIGASVARVAVLQLFCERSDSFRTCTWRTRRKT